MGLDVNGTKLLLYARSLGVDYSTTAMIGRQYLNLAPSDLNKNLRQFGVPIFSDTAHSLIRENNGYAEALLRYLGAQEIHSFDYSSYEGATQIHDLNHPIPDCWKSRYSLVLDGGSLEHVFNFPVAIKNCMEMVQPGGHYLGITPANNFMGHGFYQFSPELFFGVFTEENGYVPIRVVAFEDKRKTRWFSVKNPKEIGSRVTLMSAKPIYLFILARRVSARPIFEALPQQSDYLAIWNRAAGRPAASPQANMQHNPVLQLLRRRLPPSVRKPLRKLADHFRPTFDSNFCQPIDISGNISSPGSPDLSITESAWKRALR